MDYTKINNNLKKTIFSKLSPIIDNDYIYLDLPYYSNIGDILIWKGTEKFLKTRPYKCLYKASIETYITPKISNDVIILLQGGGNFGDIWRRHTDFYLRIIQEFPENKIIIMPQTVFYESGSIQRKDAHSMAKHSNLTICARDNVTHKLLTTNFSKNTILIVPDMAFFIPVTFLNKYRKREQNKTLFIKRNDKELQQYDFKIHLQNQKNIENHEWPSMEKKLFITIVLLFLKKLNLVFKAYKYINLITSKTIDWFAINIYMPRLIKIGVQFISRYKYIYSTRLHGTILGMLLHKKIIFFDNSYGKNCSFYTTWLKDVDDITFVHKETK